MKYFANSWNDFVGAWNTQVRCTEGETSDSRAKTLKQMCVDQNKIRSLLELSEASMIAVLLLGEVKIGVGNIAIVEKMQKCKGDLVGLLADLQKMQQLPLVARRDGDAARVIDVLLTYPGGARMYYEICLLLNYASKQQEYTQHMPGFAKPTQKTQTNGGLR